MITANDFDKLFSPEKQRLVLSFDDLLKKTIGIDQTISEITRNLGIFKDFFRVVKIGIDLFNLCGPQVVELAQKFEYDVLIEAQYYSSEDDIVKNFFKYVELAPSIIILDSRYNENDLKFIHSFVEDTAFSFGIKAPILMLAMNIDNSLEIALESAVNAEIDGVLMSKYDLSIIIFKDYTLPENLLIGVNINFEDPPSKALMQINYAAEKGAKFIILSGNQLFIPDKNKQVNLAQRICLNAITVKDIISQKNNPGLLSLLKHPVISGMLLKFYKKLDFFVLYFINNKTKIKFY